MTPEQAAARLGIAPHQVAGVALHTHGHVVTLVGGARWLVTPEVARPFVPEIDDERIGEIVEEPEEDEVRTTEPAPKPARRRRPTK